MAIWSFQAGIDTQVPKIIDIKAYEEKTVYLYFDKWVKIDGATFKVNGAVEAAERMADYTTVKITVQNTDMLREEKLTVTAVGVANFDGI